MSTATVNRIVDELDTLEVDELRQVQTAVTERLAICAASPEEERFYQALLASGLVTEIKTPPRHQRRERRLVPIQGKPLSETIIEERR